MPYHERDGRALLLGKRQELRRKLAHHIAVERDIARDPETIEDGEQHQRVIGRFSKRFRPLDQRACQIERRLRLGRRMAFGVHERGYERDL